MISYASSKHANSVVSMGDILWHANAGCAVLHEQERGVKAFAV